MNKKLMCFLLSTIIIGGTFVGCGSKQTENSKSVSQSQEQTAENKLSESQEKLLKGKYSDFDGDERTQFADLESAYSKLSNEAKEKYKNDYERLEKEKEIQVKKWEEEDKKKEMKEQEEGLDNNIIEKPVWNGSHTKEIGTYAESTYGDDMTDAELIKYYNKNIKDKDYNYFVLRKDSNPNYGIIFPGCTVAFDEGTLDKDGSIIKKSKSGFISGDKIKY